MIINQTNLDAIRKGFKSLYDAAFGAANPKWMRVAMKVPSSTKSNVYGWLGKSTKIREWIGDRVIQNLKTHDFEIKNKKWEDTVAVDADDIEDDNLGVYSPLVSELGTDVANHPDGLIFGLMASAFTTLCYDGQYLIDTDHPVLDEDGNEVSVSNHGGGAADAWFLIDDTKSVKPFIYQERKPFNFVAMDDPTDQNVFMRDEFIYGVDGRNNAGVALWQLIFGSKQVLDETSFKAARSAMENFKADGGKPLRVTPSLLVVGPSNRDAAEKLLHARELEGGGTNTLYKAVELLVVPELG